MRFYRILIKMALYAIYKKNIATRNYKTAVIAPIIIMQKKKCSWSIKK